MRGVSVKWPNWGSGFGSTALLICADFPRSVTSTPKLLVHALVLPDKSDLCVCAGGAGTIFEKIERGTVHFGRGARFRFFWGF